MSFPDSGSADDDNLDIRYDADVEHGDNGDDIDGDGDCYEIHVSLPLFVPKLKRSHTVGKIGSSRLSAFDWPLLLQIFSISFYISSFCRTLIKVNFFTDQVRLL